MAYLYGDSKEALQRRLRRIEGQIRGIQRMIDEDKYCVEILDQISAVRAALDKVGLHLMSDHIKGCVADAVMTEQRDEKVTELVGVVEKYLKS
ncbi:MAG TPA: metal-sensitive transcriptional regulator [Actinomycetota bacterium]|jgi:DNA-binding FrmR family transcriptional regulator